MQIDLLDINTVTRIIEDVESEQNRERKRKEWEAYQCVEGNTREYVYNILKKAFPKTHSKMRVSDVSVSKKVVDKLSEAYCKPPVRDITSDSEEEKNVFHDIYKKGKFNIAYQNYDSIYNLHKHGLFWVDYDFTKQIYRPMALRAFEYDVIKDPNTNELLCVCLSYPDLSVTRQLLSSGSLSLSDGMNQLISESQFDSGTESKIYALWTAQNHVIVVGKKKVLASGQTKVNYAVTYIDIPNNPQKINPLGKLNFVYKQKGQSADYPVLNPITAQSINFNLFYSDTMTAATMQGFGQGIFKYPEGSEITEIEIGYMNAIRLPQSTMPDAPDTDFTYVNASPNLSEQRALALEYLSLVLGDHGINSSQALSKDPTKFSSGLDRLLANADVQKIIELNQQTYHDLEQEVFDIIKAWELSLGKSSFSDVEEISVYYEKPQMLISETDKINNLEKLIGMGLISKADALMKINPNLTKEQAEEKLSQIQEEKLNSMQAFQLPENENTTEDQVEEV